MFECMEILSIATQRGIRVYALKGNWELSNSIQSKIIAMAFSMAAEIERDLISARTKEALRAKKAAGIKLGRPKGSGKSKLDKHKTEIHARIEFGESQASVARKFKTSPSNMHSWLQKHMPNKNEAPL